MEERNSLERISECEHYIMSVIWDAKEDLGGKEIRERVKNNFGKEWTMQTVATFLRRLEAKGYVGIYTKNGHLHYHPEVALDDYRDYVLSQMGNLLYNGKILDAVKFAAGKLGKEEYEILMEYIYKQKKEMSYK